MAEQEMEEERPDGVCIGYINGEEIKATFTNRLMNVIFYDARSKARVIGFGGVNNHEGSLLHVNRNEVTKSFLKTDCKWFLWLDTDMLFPADVVDRMVESAEKNDVGVLGALCFSGGQTGIIKPTMYRLRNDDGRSDMGASMEHLTDFENDEVLDVDATGCACLLIRRDVIEAVAERYKNSPNRWYAFTERKGLAYGEDWEFCFRAVECGYKIKVDTAIQIGHVKSTVLDVVAYRRYQQELAHFGTEAAVSARHMERFNPGRTFKAPQLSRTQRRLRERAAARNEARKAKAAAT